MASLLLLVAASLHRRLDSMLVMVERTFFTGGQKVLSLIVIVPRSRPASGNRLCGDGPRVESRTGPRSADPLRLFLLFLLRILDQPNLQRRAVEVDSTIRRSTRPGRPTRSTRAPAPRPCRPRSGSSRSMVERGWPSSVSPSGTRGASLSSSTRRAKSFGESLKAIRRTPTLTCVTGFVFYFGVLNIFLVLLVVLAGWWLSEGTQKAAVTVTADAAGTIDGAGERKGTVDLKEKIFGGDKSQVILLAASGGGTRAAVYTTAVLRGLSDLGALDRLVLTSGVSGGGAALAYFAGHYDRLVTGDDDAWDKFECAIDDPFIWDVLDGSHEWRIFGGTRLGQLLAESFERRFEMPKKGIGDDEGPKGLGDVDQLGLIFNTSLAGHLTVPECREGESFDRCASRNKKKTQSGVAGGRLIFTNLTIGDAFPKPPELDEESSDMVPLDIKFDYTVIQDKAVPLSVAAALNANFPPVFSNAAVDVIHEDAGTVGDRYWVTDGGAVENRGVLSLLFALRDAIQREGPTSGRRAPEVLIVVVEASGDSSSYSQDRGIGSAFGAASKIGSQLMRELLVEVREDLISLGGQLDLHYLEMPDPLRVNGGLGTHWMFPTEVRLGDPISETCRENQIQRLRGSGIGLPSSTASPSDPFLRVASPTIFELRARAVRWPKTWLPCGKPWVKIRKTLLSGE